MVRATVLAVVIGVVSTLVAPIHAGAVDAPSSAGTSYEHPVDASIIDPFRPPATPFGSGNRGIEYATEPGTEVGAAAAGTVIFAGQVGGVLHVSLLHADGRISSYSDLADVRVRLHQEVDRGDVVGLARGRLHVGVREAGRYVDPEELFGGEVRAAHLIPESPLGGGGWRTPGQEIAELRLVTLELQRRGGGGLAALGGLAGRLAGWGGSLIQAGSNAVGVLVDGATWLGTSVRDALVVLVPVLFEVAWYLAPFVVAAYNPLLAGLIFSIAIPLLSGETPPLVHFAADLVLTPVRVVGRAVEWWEHRSNCTPADVEPPAPAGRRVAVLVGGFDSTSAHASIGGLDTVRLGYADTDVIGFSYAGGRTPGRFDATVGEVADDLAGLEVTDYGQAESALDLASRGSLLADLLEDVARDSPGTTIDVMAHSQGGIVARMALQELRLRPGGAEVIESVGLVATMASPHQGADLATIAVVLGSQLDASTALQLAGTVSGSTLAPAGTNIEDLARGSHLLDSLESTSPPPGPNYLTLAARGDLVVTDARARFDGAEHVTLPGLGPASHSALPSAPATTRELALGLAGLPPTCQGLSDFLGDVLVAEVTQVAISTIGVGLAAATLPISPSDALEPVLTRW